MYRSATAHRSSTAGCNAAAASDPRPGRLPIAGTSRWRWPPENSTKRPGAIDGETSAAFGHLDVERRPQEQAQLSPKSRRGANAKRGAPARDFLKSGELASPSLTLPDAMTTLRGLRRHNLRRHSIADDVAPRIHHANGRFLGQRHGVFDGFLVRDGDVAAARRCLKLLKPVSDRGRGLHLNNQLANMNVEPV